MYFIQDDTFQPSSVICTAVQSPLALHRIPTRPTYSYIIANDKLNFTNLGNWVMMMAAQYKISAQYEVILYLSKIRLGWLHVVLIIVVRIFNSF